MAASRTAGTPAILQLRDAGVEFTVHEFGHEPGEGNYGLVAAAELGVEAERVFKTLVVDVHGRGAVEQVVGIVPVSGQLSLRELAVAVEAKRAEMCPPAVAQRITGYVVGGISPFGQRKRLRTVIDETCELWDTVFVSGGRRGLDVELAPDVLVAILDATLAGIAAP